MAVFFLLHDFETYFSDWYLNYLSVKPPLLNGTGPHWWLVNIGSGNGLVPSGYKPLPELMLTKFYAYGVTRPQWVNYPRRPTEPHCFRTTHLKVVTMWDTFLHYCPETTDRPILSACATKMSQHPINTVKNYLIIPVPLMLPWKFPFVYYPTNLHLSCLLTYNPR